MKKSLQEHISQLDFQKLNVLEVCKALNNVYSVIDVQKALRALKSAQEVNRKNDFGKCGIDPEVNPCGDADEY